MFKGFASLRTSLTLLVFLRRISRELHRANELAEARLALQYPAWYKASSIKSPTQTPLVSSKLGDLSTPTIEEWNRDYREKHPEQTDTEEDEHNIS